MKRFIALLILIVLPISISAQTQTEVIPEQRIAVPTYLGIDGSDTAVVSLVDAEMAVRFWYQWADSMIVEIPEAGYTMQYNADSWYLYLQFFYGGEQSWGVMMELTADSTGNYIINSTPFLKPEPDPFDVNRDGSVNFADLFYLVYRLLGKL